MEIEQYCTNLEAALQKHLKESMQEIERLNRRIKSRETTNEGLRTMYADLKQYSDQIAAHNFSLSVRNDDLIKENAQLREPLSEDVLMSIAEECTSQFFNGVHQNATIHFARVIEQTHGIGVTND